MTLDSAYTLWCKMNSVSHGHCLYGHEHPQPANYAGDARLICGKCWFDDLIAVEIVPCRPATGCIDE